MSSKSAPRNGHPFRVGRSRTGLGLFATEAIPKGTEIVEYLGRRISTEEADTRERVRQNRYLFEIDENWTIDGSARSNIARYVNHACRPNADTVNDGEHITFEARRLIRPGEEITCNYGKTYLEVFFGPNGCRCATCVPEHAAKAKKATAKKAAGKKAAAKKAATKKAATKGAKAKRAPQAASPRSRQTRSDAKSRS